MRSRAQCGSVVRLGDDQQVVDGLTFTIQHFTSTDDPADLVKVKRDLVKVKQAERVVSSVQEVAEVVVWRQVSVTCQRRANLRPNNTQSKKHFIQLGR